MHRLLTLAFFVLGTVLPVTDALGQFDGWSHTGSIFLVTTPEGANLPESASEENVPVLVHLHRDFFDFASAQPSGQDIRFSANGSNLAYQIDHWDAVAGSASIWFESLGSGATRNRN